MAETRVLAEGAPKTTLRRDEGLCNTFCWLFGSRLQLRPLGWLYCLRRVDWPAAEYPFSVRALYLLLSLRWSRSSTIFHPIIMSSFVSREISRRHGGSFDTSLERIGHSNTSITNQSVVCKECVLYKSENTNTIAPKRYRQKKLWEFWTAIHCNKCWIPTKLRNLCALTEF